jgi:four helix bundle protein
MGFDALKVSLEMIEALRPLLERLKQKNPDLVDQLERAASSVAMNLAEGAKRRGKDREHFFRTASGSNAEVRAALAVAIAWGYIDRPSAANAEILLDRLGAMLWRLSPARG